MLERERGKQQYGTNMGDNMIPPSPRLSQTRNEGERERAKGWGEGETEANRSNIGTHGVKGGVGVEWSWVYLTMNEAGKRERGEGIEMIQPPGGE